MSEPLQIALTTPLADLLPAKGIRFNFDELREGVTAIASRYEGLLITEDDIDRGKADRAALNKFIASIEDFRKMVKREWNKPYASFEAQMKELVAICAAPRDAIDAQLKEFEEKRKGDRIDQLGAFFDAHIGELADLVSFDSVLETKWLNKSCTETTWQTELLGKIQQMKRDIDAARNIAPEGLEAETVEQYLKTRSLGETIQWATERKAQLAKLHALTAAHGEPETPPPPTHTPTPPAPAPTSPEPVLTFTLRFTGPKSKLVALRRFMEENGISYEKIVEGVNHVS